MSCVVGYVRLTNRGSHSAGGMEQEQSGRMASPARDVFVKACVVANRLRAGGDGGCLTLDAAVGGVGVSAWP